MWGCGIRRAVRTTMSVSFVSGVALGLATAGAPAEPGRVPCDGRSAPAACVWDSQVQRCRGTCGQGRVCAQVDDTRNCYCVRPEASSARGRAARAD